MQKPLGKLNQFKNIHEVQQGFLRWFFKNFVLSNLGITNKTTCGFEDPEKENTNF